MKSRSSHHSPLKQLGLGALACLALAAGGAQAGNESCLLDRPMQNSAPQSGAPGGKMDSPFLYSPVFQDKMRQIEQALADGRVSPYEAGRLMRQQMELAQFQQGFLAGGPLPRGASGAVGHGGCGLSPELSAKLAPLGDMAISGMQSAGSLMRTLMRETERLLQEQKDVPESTL